MSIIGESRNFYERANRNGSANKEATKNWVQYKNNRSFLSQVLKLKQQQLRVGIN